MLIAQISDLHVMTGQRAAEHYPDTAACLSAAVSHLNSLAPQPDLVIATGDLVDAGSTEEYQRLRRLLEPLTMPLHVIPGNHDAREPFRAAFADASYLPEDGEFLHYTLEDHPIRLVMLDTLVPGRPHGALCSARLDWLARRLAEQPDRPTIIFMHHPPFATGIRHMDAMGLLEGADALGELVARHPNVERVAAGHVHRPIHRRWYGTVASVAPSTAHQVTLDLGPESPGTYLLEPPGVELMHWQDGEGLVSHLSYIGHFEGPFRF